MRLLPLIRRVLARVIGGRPPDGPTAAAGSPDVPGVLEALFRAHGLAVDRDGPWLILPSGRAGGRVAQEIDRGSALLVQLDVLMEVEPGRWLVESCAGLGAGRESALGDAIRTFAAGTFHVLLAAVCGRANDRAAEEVWEVAGRPRRVTLGEALSKGDAPDPEGGPPRWFGRLESAVKASDLEGGTHWVRFYHARGPGLETTCEVLLDNEPWDDVRGAMVSFPWPAPSRFSSVRLFLILRDARD